jgi:hypothetical protein
MVDTHLSRSAGEPPDRQRSMPPRHRFLEPIHNVKERGEPLRSATAAAAAKIWSSYLEKLVATARARGSDGGAYRDRTDDLKLAKLALSQLS